MARMRASFVKMHGCGNDFVVFDERAGALGITPARAAALSDRRTGIGCDQLIILEPPPADSDAAAFMRIYNPDGSESGACGNATRCVAELLINERRRERLSILTIAGELSCALLPKGWVKVDMGPALIGWRDVPLAREMDTLHVPLSAGDAACASMGNPHATFFVPDAEAVDVVGLGSVLEHDPLFPERANIGFATILDEGRIRLRLWERGAGLTLACGSGACATLVNAHRRGLIGRRATLLLDGGALEIEWGEPVGGQPGRVTMTGPSVTSFRGEIELDQYPS